MELLERENISIYCFADDTVIVVSGLNWESTKHTAETALKIIKNWLDESLLSLNIEKTKFMTFSLSSRNLPNLELLMIHEQTCKMDLQCRCDKSIERTASLKYLGVILDENLTWKEHLKYVTTKIRKLIHKFYELRNILTLRTLKTIYYALVESIINYGLAVWGNAGTTIISKLSVAQKWIIKIIMYKNKRYPSDLLYKESEIMNVQQLYIKSVIRYMIKNPDYRIKLNHGVNTRNVVQGKVELQNPKHTACQNHVYCVGPKIFNDMPDNFKESGKYKRNKSKITKWIIESNYKLHYVI